MMNGREEREGNIMPADGNLMSAIASCISTWVPYILFIAIAERCVNIIRNAFSGREHYF